METSAAMPMCPLGSKHATMKLAPVSHGLRACLEAIREENKRLIGVDLQIGEGLFVAARERIRVVDREISSQATCALTYVEGISREISAARREGYELALAGLRKVADDMERGAKGVPEPFRAVILEGASMHRSAAVALGFARENALRSPEAEYAAARR